MAMNVGDGSTNPSTTASPSNTGGAQAAAAAAAAVAQRAAEAAAAAAAAAAAKAAAAAAAAAALQKQAEAAKQQAATAKQSLATATPQTKPALTKTSQQADATAQKTQSAADGGKQTALTLQSQAKHATAVAQSAMSNANQVAQSKGLSAPYTPEQIRSAGTDGFANVVQGNNVVALSAPAGSDTAAALGANQQYAKLSQLPGAAPMLKALGIHDGDSLRSAGQMINTPTVSFGTGAASDLTKALAGVDPKVASQVLQAVGQNAAGAAGQLLSNPQFADAVGGSKQLPQIVSSLESGNWSKALQVATSDPKVVDAASSALVKDPVVQQSLSQLGLSSKNIAEAGAALPDFIRAGEAFAGGHFHQAATTLGEALQKSPNLTSDVVGSFVDALPANVKGQLQSLGLGPDDVKQLGKALPTAFSAISDASKGNWLGATNALKQVVTQAPQLTDKVFGAVAQDSGAQKFFSNSLGIDLSKLPKPSQAIPQLINLGQSLGKQPPDVSGAVQALQGLAANTDPSAFGGVLSKVGSAFQNSSLPDGVKQNVSAFFSGVGSKLSGLAPGSTEAKNLLNTLSTDSNLPTIAGQLAKGDTTGALNTLAGDPKLVDAASSALTSMPAVKDTLSKLGIDVSKLPDAGKTFPPALQLAQALSANPPDVSGAVKAMQGIAQSGIDPSAFSGVLGKASSAFQNSALPDNIKQNVTSFLDGVGSKLSGLAPGSTQAKALLNTLATDSNLPQLAGQLAKGNFGGALKTLTGDPQLMDAAGDALASMPVVKDSLSKLGIDVSKLPEPSKVLPAAVDLAQSMSANPPNVKQTVTDLQTLAQNVDPSAFSGVLAKVSTALKASPLPAGVKQNIGAFLDGVGSKLSSLAPGSAQAKTLLSTLATDKNLPQLADQLSKGQFGDALKTLAGDGPLMDSVSSAITSMPVVSSALQSLGIDPTKLPDPSKVVPAAMDLSQALSANPPDVARTVTDLQQLGQNIDPSAFSGVLGKIGDALGKAPLPDGAKQNLSTFFNGLGQKLSGLAPGSAEAKTLLSTLTTDKNLPQIAQQLASGDIGGAFKSLSADGPLMDATSSALLSMPDVKKALSAVGIDASKLPAPSQVVPAALDLAKSLSANPPNLMQSVKDLQTLGQNIDPSAFAGVVGKISQAVQGAAGLGTDAKQRIGEFFNTLQTKLGQAGSGAQDLLKTLSTDTHLPALVGALTSGKIGDALKTIAGDTNLLGAVGDLITSMPSVQKFVSDKLGVDLSKLPNPEQTLGAIADMASSLSASPPKIGEAAKSLLGLAGTLDPTAFKGLYDAVSSKLPAGVKSLLDTVVNNPNAASTLATLATDPNLPTMINQAAGGDWGGALRTLGSDPQLMGLVGQGLTAIPQVKDFLKSNLGLTDAQISQVGSDVVPDLAAALASAKSPADAAQHLLAAAAKLPAGVAQQIFDASASKLGLPSGVTHFVDGLFQNPGVQQLLANPNLSTAIGQLVTGKPAAALQTITSDPSLLDAAGTALVNVPAVKNFLQDNLGIDASTLPNLSQVLPHLSAALSAVTSSPPDFGQALSQVGQIATLAPDAVEGMAGKLASKLPDGLAKTMLSDPKLLDGILKEPQTQQSLGELMSGDSSKVLDGLSGLLHDDGLRDPVLNDIGNDPAIKSELNKIGLDPSDLVEAGDAAPHLLDAVQAFSKNDLQDGVNDLGAALQAAPDLATKLGGKIWNALPQSVQTGLSKIGLTQADLPQVGAALPDLISAGEKIAGGDWKGALSEIGQAVEAAPNITAKIVNAAAQNIPDNSDTHLLKAALTDPKFVADLAGDPTLHGALSQMLSGDFIGGVKSLSGDSQTLGDLGSVLLSDPNAAASLAKIGITSPSDFAQLGKSVGDVLQLGQDLSAGHYETALTDAGSLFTDVPNDMKAKVLDAVAKDLKLPPGLGDFLVQGGEALSDPGIRAQVGKAIQAFKDGKPTDFISALAETGREISTKYPGAAVGFLDLMGKLPGSVGRFFSNHDLNSAVVDSGSMGDMFDAVEKLSTGDISGAMTEMAAAGGSLLGYGTHYSKTIGWGPVSKTITAPVGDKGLKAFGELFGQFVDALPTDVKTKVLDEVASLTAKAGASIIPGGSLLGLFGDVPALVGQIRQNPKDYVGLALDGAKVGLDIAGAFPGAGAVTGPLNTAVGIISFVHDAVGLVGDVKAFQKEFAFGS